MLWILAHCFSAGHQLNLKKKFKKNSLFAHYNLQHKEPTGINHIDELVAKAQRLGYLLLTQASTRGPDLKAEKGKKTPTENRRTQFPLRKAPSAVLSRASSRGES